MKRHERVAVPKRRRFARVVIHLSPSSRPYEALIAQAVELVLHFFGGRVDGECPAEFVSGQVRRCTETSGAKVSNVMSGEVY